MRKTVLTLFFSLHLLFIFFQALWSTVDGYWDFYYDKKPQIPLVFKLLSQNNYNESYFILTGINTGYGFFGIHASSSKYLRLSFYDKNDKLIKTSRFTSFRTTNGISRTEGYASFLVNYIADTQNLIKVDTLLDTDNSLEALNLRKTYQFRKDFVIKSLKHYGKKEAEKIKGCSSYQIELLTVLPEDIWQRETKTKPSLYVIQKAVFSV
ncbi:MAG: hypothetical protein ACK5H1_09175 [Tenacibaculum sp.]